MAASTPASLLGGQGSSIRRGHRVVSLLVLGAALARRGPLAILSMGVSVLTTLVLCAITFALARREGDPPVHGILLLTSSALAWGGGFLHAVAISAGTLRRDRVEGIRHLFVTRTSSVRGYLLARVGGLGIMLAVLVGGGTLFVSAVSLVGATRLQVVVRTMHSTFSAVVYAVAFAAVIAPVAFAALGKRTRISGYFVLLLVLVVPEVLANALTGPLPGEVTELCAIPSALAALRSSIAPGTVDPFRFLRALVAVGLIAGIAMVFVHRSVIVVESEDP